MSPGVLPIAFSLVQMDKGMEVSLYHLHLLYGDPFGYKVQNAFHLWLEYMALMITGLLFLDMRHLRTVQCDMRCEFAPFFFVSEQWFSKTSLWMNDCVFDDCWSSSSSCIQNLLVLVASVQPVCFIILIISSKSLSTFKFFVSLLCIICQSFARISCGHASSLSDASRKSLISISSLRSTS